MPLPQAANQSVSSSPAHASPVHWLTLLLLQASATALRLFCLACKPFWSDECFSAEIAGLDWRNFLHVTWWREANMSLYYVLLRVWLHFGHSQFFIHSLSVLLAASTLPAIFWLARILYDRRVALIATALLAFNAYHVRYSQEARSYTLFVLLATLSSALLIAWLRQPTRRKRLEYIVVSVLAVYAHFYALLLLGAHWIMLRCFGSPADDAANGKIPPDLRRAWTIIGIAVAPLLIFVAKTGAGPIKWIHRPGVGDLLIFFEHLAGGAMPWSGWLLTLALAAALLTAVAPIGKELLLRDQGLNVWRVQFLLVLLFFPVALTVVLSFARPVFLARYMIFSLPALLILAAAGLARLRPPWLLASALAVVLLLSLPGVSFVYTHDFDTDRDAAGAATDFILDHAQPGDAIIFYIPATRLPYEFFRSQRAGESTATPQLGPEVLFPHHGPGLDYRDFTGKPTPDLLRSAPAAHPRIWVMFMNNQPAWSTDPTTATITQSFSAAYPKLQRWQFPKVEVRLYSKE